MQHYPHLLIDAKILVK